MTINLISLSTVKTQLGISDTTYDSALTALLPIVSADVRRIMNTEYNVFSYADIDSGETSFTADIDFEMGDVIVASNVTTDTYVSGYNELTGAYTLSAAASDDDTSLVKTINIRQWPAISKMIWYRYSKQSTTAASEKNVQSKSYGPVSLTYSASEINGQYDYPQKLIDDLGTPFAKVFSGTSRTQPYTILESRILA